MQMGSIAAILRKSIPSLLWAFLGFSLWPSTAFAQTDNWLGGAGNWNDGTKWSAGVPSNTSNVFIDNGNPKASPVTVSDNEQSASVTIDGDDSLTLVDGALLTVYGPTISNAGTFAISTSSGNAYLDFGGNVTLTGTLNMSNSSHNYLFGYGQPSPGASLTNDSTIQGAGNIGFSGGIGNGNSFINQGTVNANQTTPLLINIGGAATVTNTGTLKATNGATLQLDNGIITNTGGTIHADPSSIVSLYGLTVNGGSLTSTGSGTIQAVCCLGYSTLNGVTVTAGSTLQFNDNNINYVQGTITNNGSMQVNSVGNGTYLDINGAVTLKGSGALTMSNNSHNYLFGYGQQAPGASLANQSTIQGAGNIGFSGGIGNGNTFTNQATLNANQPTNALTINVGGASTFNNAGLLEATKGATLALQNGAINNNGGIIHADPASTVTLYGMTLSGGTLTTNGTGKFVAICCLGYSTLDGVTISGAFQWHSNNIGYLQGTVTNNGPMTFNSPPGTNVNLDVNGAVTLTGSGTLTSTNSNNAMMGYGQSSGASLLNQSTIQGTLTISAYNGNTINNQGTIFASQAGGLTITTGNSGTFTNNGTLMVKSGSSMYIAGGGFTNFSVSTLTGGKYTAGGTLAFDGAYIVDNASNITLSGAGKITNQSGMNALANFATNTSTGLFSLTSGAKFTTTITSGIFSNAGKVTVGAGSGMQILGPPPPPTVLGTYTQTGSTAVTTVDGVLTGEGGVNINSGKLYGNGTIAAALVSKASVTVGDSLTKAGKLSPSTYSQTSAATLNIQIGGTAAGTQYSQLAVANGTSLDGILNVKLIKGFTPAIGDVYTILTASARSGQFKTTHLPPLSGAHWVVTYNPTNVTLTVASGS